MLITPLGSVIEASPLAFQNAKLPIDVRELGKVMAVRELMPEKA